MIIWFQIKLTYTKIHFKLSYHLRQQIWRWKTIISNVRVIWSFIHYWRRVSGCSLAVNCIHFIIVPCAVIWNIVRYFHIFLWFNHYDSCNWKYHLTEISYTWYISIFDTIIMKFPANISLYFLTQTIFRRIKSQIFAFHRIRNG